MRYLTVILLLFISLPLAYGQEVKVSMRCQGAWPPGESIPVTIIIEKGEMTGFARFFQDLPTGFKVESVESSGADFYWDNNQVNLVWVKLPAGNTVEVQYLVIPDISLAGSFRLGGRFDFVTRNSERKSVEIEPVVIRLDRNARVEEIPRPGSKPADNMVVASGESSVQNETHQEEVENIRVDFRVQVAIASQRLSKSELESRIGCQLRESVKTLKSGNMYKYQSGSFRNYEDAAVYLAELKNGGVKDAFIVAFRGDEQISIELARSLSR